MAGITGRLYQQFALTIAVSVLISAFNALTLSPALAAMLLRPRASRAGLLGRLGRGFNRVFERVTNGYVHTNARLVRKLAIPLVLLVGVGAALGGDRAQAALGLRARRGQRLRASSACSSPTRRRCSARRPCSRRSRRSSAAPRASAPTTPIAGFSFFTGSAASYVGTGFIGFKPWKRARAAGSHGQGDRRASSTRQFAQHPRGARLRAGAARDPRHQRGGRLQHVPAGPQRRHRRVPGRRT